MPYSLAEAAAAAGRNRSSILRAIKAGRLSAVRDAATNEWRIEPAEPHRVYPPGKSVEAATERATPDAQPRNDAAPAAELAELRVRLDAAQREAVLQAETIADLRRRLDAADAERRQASERLHALLTDQRATVRRKRWWWPWRG